MTSSRSSRPRPEKWDEVTNTSSRVRPPIGTDSETRYVAEKTNRARPEGGTRWGAS